MCNRKRRNQRSRRRSRNAHRRIHNNERWECARCPGTRNEDWARPCKSKSLRDILRTVLVTPDELQDKKVAPAKFDLRMKATVNGKQLSDGNMNKMHWTFSQMIARASQSVELRIGEVFGSGTVGTGSLLELGQEAHPWLKSGDHVELEVERLGVLRNRIIETAES